MKLAYDLRDSQLSGPGSINSDRFDIVAKASAPIQSERDLKLMLQSLLTERFNLQLHREERVLSVYALVIGKGGPKFSRSTGEGKPSLRGKGLVIAQLAPMRALADFLSGPLQRPVIDMTGLEGAYDFRFDLTAYATPDPDRGKDPDVVTMIMSGLEPQLGLKLESRNVPEPVLVIDHMQVPDEN